MVNGGRRDRIVVGRGVLNTTLCLSVTCGKSVVFLRFSPPIKLTAMI